MALVGVIVAWLWLSRPPQPTVLSFSLGDTFEQVVKNSNYPVAKRSNSPNDDPGENQFGATWVTEPAVIIRFTDPKHGFTLPPTKFAALTYSGKKAVSLATSPMLDALPFEEAVAVLNGLQTQFKSGKWEPYQADGSIWFDLTHEGRKRLFTRMFEPGYAQTVTLRIPKKYSMTFRLKCVEGCWTREPPYKFLIDIGLGVDTQGWDPRYGPFPEP